MTDRDDDDRKDGPRRPSSGSGSGGPNRAGGSGRPSFGDRGRPSGDRPAGGRPPRGDRASEGRPSAGRTTGGRPSNDRPQRGDRPSSGDRASYGDRPQRGERPSSGDRPQRGDRPSYGDRPQRGERPSSGDRPQRGGRPGGDDRRGAGPRAGSTGRGDRREAWKPRETPEDRDPFGIKSVRPAQDVAHVPDDVEPRDLDKVARGELKTLSKENADWVAKHLVMAGRLIDEDPEEAHKHALSAGRRAGRISVVRETIAITAYQVGDYALTLRELRTYRRISGRDDQLPLMVDSERGLGRPERALELGRSVDVSTLDAQVRVSLAIAMSGARLDLGQPQAALGELEIPQLDRTKAFSYSPALFAAYGTVLEDLGRPDEGEKWLELADRAEDALAALEDGGADGETVEIVEEDVDVVDDAPVVLEESDDESEEKHDEEHGQHDETADPETTPPVTDDLDDHRG